MIDIIIFFGAFFVFFSAFFVFFGCLLLAFSLEQKENKKRKYTDGEENDYTHWPHKPNEYFEI